MSTEWQAHVVDSPQNLAVVIYLAQRLRDGARFATADVGGVTVADVGPGEEGPEFLRVGYGNEDVLTALAAALVEYAPAQSETEGRLDEVRSALDVERQRVDHLLGMGGVDHPSGAPDG